MVKMGRVFVVGVGMTKFEKPGNRDDDYSELAKEAITEALKDGKVSMAEMQRAVVGYVYGDSTSGQRAIYEVAMSGMPIYNVNNNCATGSSALMLAKEFVEAGHAECVLAVGFEKMQPGSLTSKFRDRVNPVDKHVTLMAKLVGVDKSPIAAQMIGNAGIEHMKKFGTRLEHFAKIAQKNHKHSVNNPYSQFRDEYSLQDILNSPKVFGPLTKLQCCPTSDGAAAAIVVSEDFVRRHGLEGQAIEIIGMEMATDFPSTFNENSLMNLVGYDMTKKAAERLFQKANLKPSDVQVVELHDCFSTNELIMYEALGLCPPGKAGEFIDRGDNTYGGKFVINPSGGLISRGHPLGATGIAQCAELCWQLRGEAGARQVPRAKIALQHNLGLGGAVVVALYTHGFPAHQSRIIGDRQVAAEISERHFKASPYLRILEQAMILNEDNLIDKFRGIYGFRVKKGTEEGFWVINAKERKGSVEFNSKTKPDVTAIVEDEDVVDLITGRLGLKKAFFQGKIKIQGNMGLAMKLTELQEIVGKKFDQIRSKL